MRIARGDEVHQPQGDDVVEDAGLLIAPDEGARAHTEAELIAKDVGVYGGTATAEEATMHVVSEPQDPE